jgi:hypothetical protein
MKLPGSPQKGQGNGPGSGPLVDLALVEGSAARHGRQAEAALAITGLRRTQVTCKRPQFSLPGLSR